jgi:hypothetical protein
MLAAGPAPVREVLLEHLSRIEGRQATEALARLALFDPRPEVRRGAIRSLSGRPQWEHRDVLLGGFRHPWPPVADHAAEALVGLRAREAVPALVRLLGAPDVRATYRKAGKGEELFLKEMVRIHHVRNCLLCHPPHSAPRTRPAPRCRRAEPLEMLDQELARLPEGVREPLVLCYLDGLTHEEAARRLSLLPRTLKGRLDWRT